MLKLWELEWTEQLNCEEGCAFGELCNRYGSAWVIETTTEASDDESLKIAFEGCGSFLGNLISYKPLVILKERRF